MSFVDKISNGVSVMVIENLKSSIANQENYYRDVLTFVCGGAISLSLIALALLTKGKIGNLKRNGDWTVLSLCIIYFSSLLNFIYF